MIRNCITFSLLLCLAQLCCGQTTTPIDKTRALQNIKIVSASGWKEVMSDEGRFRVLFPGNPVVSKDVANMTGFKLSGSGANWLAYYSDFGRHAANDETLRNNYRQSVEAIARNGSTVVRQNDIYVLGKLGTEFVLQRAGTTSYMRGLLVGSRFWTLAVDSSTEANRDFSNPKDVQQFFDSFTFWE